MLNKFFAVTKTSLYEVTDGSEGPAAVKIALKGKSHIGVGERIKGGTHLAICDALQMFTPSREEPKVEERNTRYWGGHSSRIVALFTEETKARECLELEDLVPCDPRWLESTERVLELVGEDSPYVQVCTWPGLALMKS